MGGLSELKKRFKDKILSRSH